MRWRPPVSLLPTGHPTRSLLVDDIDDPFIHKTLNLHALKITWKGFGDDVRDGRKGAVIAFSRRISDPRSLGRDRGSSNRDPRLSQRTSQRRMDDFDK